MELSRRQVLRVLGASVLLGPIALEGCSSSADTSGTGSTGTGSTGTAATGSSGASTTAASTAITTAATSGATSGALALGRSGWSYDEANDVYHRIGASYVAAPAATDYETLGIFVPGAYFTGTKDADGTYTVAPNASGSVAGFTAATAPIVMPVNTPGYSAQQPPSSYSYELVSTYLDAGFVYVAAGMRGRDTETDSYTGNAPWGVTDLKAAVRFLRYHAADLAGDTTQIYVFGHSGGGAQSTVMGASGDSALYTPYLSSLGAAMTDADGNDLSDAVAGVMAWCPITSLDLANAAYEWNMGQFATSGTRAEGTWTKAYSLDLADAFAAYVNQLGLVDADGTKLALAESSSGSYLAGTYHDHVLGVIEASLNDFLAVTTFPYTPSSTGMGGGPGGGPGGGGAPPSGLSGAATGSATTSTGSTTYDTVQDYIDGLNAGATWVSYDASSATAKVLDLGGFVASQKSASKDVGAFDGIDRAATENAVLGIGSAGLHFATVARDVLAAGEAGYAALSGWSDSYAAAGYTSDFATTDSIGVDVLTRGQMYDPMYFVSSGSDGYQSATVAPRWRIRTGIMQGDTASTVEIDLALALAMYGVDDVDFATIWGQGHTQAELTGDATTNFIAWVTAAATA